MTKIRLIHGDITLLAVDAIVNAANRSLLGGGGVDGAIHRAAGSQLLEACKKLNGCETGQAKITPGFRLPAKYVIHTVGPVWRGGQDRETELLSQCYLNSLELAKQYECRQVAFPNISTGVYGFPKSKAAHTALSAVKDYLTAYTGFEEIIFVCFDQENYQLYKDLLPSFFSQDQITF